jgi:putative transcriptional regulator
MANKMYKSEVGASIHETASDLFEAGLIDKRTMRRFDERCLTPVQALAAEEIRGIRAQAQVSQRVFAQYLNVSPGIVSQWERGEKRPAGSSLKLLLIVRAKGLEAIA